MPFYEIDLVCLSGQLIAFLMFFTLHLLIYEVSLAAFVVVVVHCRQVWSVACIHASWKESQHRVSYLVCHRVWIEEFASYLDREVRRGALPTATNTTLSKVHGAAKNQASCKMVCQAQFVKKLVNVECERLEKQWGRCESRQWDKGQWSGCLEKADSKIYDLAPKRQHWLQFHATF